VLSGAIRSQNSATGPAKVYKAGESFFEPAGSAHLVSENASTTEPASMLVILVADDGARLTTSTSAPTTCIGEFVAARSPGWTLRECYE
jgi:quercetin dioxygenase-like cupin family protein